MNTFNINRRGFLKNSSALLAMSQFGAYGLDLINPAKPYKVGLIGTGWYGKSDLFRLIQVAPVEVLALCDTDKNMLKAAADLVQQRIPGSKRPSLYGDYRKMLKENQLDIVLIGTPDHWHALTAIEAIKAGANVYVQKPISVDILEGEAMVAAARKYNKVVQVGTQRRSTPHWVDAKKNYIDSGKLGNIKHVEMCCYYPMRASLNPAIEPVPDFFDYEMWAGPAPKIPFIGLPHRRIWRSMMEYGNGIVGDMCVHMYDAARWMLDLGWPKSVTSYGGINFNKESVANISDTQTAIFQHDGLSCIWTHRSWGSSPDPAYPWALFLYGEKGTLKLSTMTSDFVPMGRDAKTIHQEALFEREKFPEDVTEAGIELHAAAATRAHMLDFIKCIEDKTTKPVADILQGHISSSSCILANMSMKLGRTLAYDPEKKIIKNDAEATKMLARDYRSPWIHPTLKNI